MASAPTEPRPVRGRIDRAGRLIAADSELEALQREAGSDLGQALALAQIATIAQLARELGTAVSRPALVGSSDQDIAVWVNAWPEGDDVALSLENWRASPAPGPRLGSLLAGASDSGTALGSYEWSADEELRIISLSSELARLLAVEPAAAAGMALTRLLRFEENDEGEMPLIAALAARRSFDGQRASTRSAKDERLLLSGEVVTAADGGFAGFRGTARLTDDQWHEPGEQGAEAAANFDHALDDVLRSPLDRIIESAGRIVDRADGPLRSDYANYGSDIAAAARHLSSVIREMGENPGTDHRAIDLPSLAAEAVVMVEPVAEERNITVELRPSDPLRALGQDRAIIQIVVNLIGNAVRHSPDGETVSIQFESTAGTVSLSVSDHGPGIDPADQQRIFERFERADVSKEGTGLGLAISRRLARSMGGDVTLQSAPGQGARFTLTLPRA